MTDLRFSIPTREQTEGIPNGSDGSSFSTKCANVDDEYLLPRNMQDSFLEGFIPLSSDEVVRERYFKSVGHLKIGKLLEDMDVFAVFVAYKHIYARSSVDVAARPYSLVTAHVDQIDFTEFVPEPNEDIKLSGHVSWVGRSSIEVVVRLEQQKNSTWHKISRGLFLIAVRDASSQKAALVHPLFSSNEYEKTMLRDGEDRNNKRIMKSAEHVSRVIPTFEEQRLIYELYVESSKFDDSSTDEFGGGLIGMDKCTITNVIFSHSDDLNAHNTVYGGIIMRNATEIAWILGFLFSKRRPFLKSISDVSFHTSIAVNSLIQMDAKVVYTKLNYYHIIVLVRVLDPVKRQACKSNTLHFTFESPVQVKRVFPKSYHEAMSYIDGKRHFDSVMSGDYGSEVGDLIDNYKVDFSKLSKL